MLNAATLPLFVVRWSVVTVLLMLAQAHGLGREAHTAENLTKWYFAISKQMFPSAGEAKLKALDLLIPRKNESASLFEHGQFLPAWDRRFEILRGEWGQFATAFPMGAMWFTAMHLASLEDAAHILAAAFPPRPENAPACTLVGVVDEKPSDVFTFSWTGKGWVWILGISAYQNR